MPTISFFATAVVHPVKVVEWIAVPTEIAGTADAVMLFDTVGIAVPVAIFQISIVAVPVSTAIFHAEMLHANGTVV